MKCQECEHRLEDLCKLSNKVIPKWMIEQVSPFWCQLNDKEKSKDNETKENM